jgi:hypothetical protein
MNTVSLAFVVLLPLSISLTYGKTKPSTNNETCFLGVPFVKGGTVTVKLANVGHGAHSITIQPWLSDGSPLQNVSQIVPGSTATEVRVAVASETPTFGWFQITEEGHAITVSAAYEYLNGNTLTTIPMLPVFRHPSSDGAVRSALEYSIHHRYTYDVFALQGALYVFVNLSDYPVQAGMCQENYPDCVVPSLPRTVEPHAGLVFTIDQKKRFLVMHSTPGYSVATAVEWTEGLKQIFTANSSITFDLVK